MQATLLGSRRFALNQTSNLCHENLCISITGSWFTIADYNKLMSTTNWHLTRALPMTEQQGRLPSVSAELEPCAAAPVALSTPLREFRVE